MSLTKGMAGFPNPSAQGPQSLSVSEEDLMERERDKVDFD